MDVYQFHRLIYCKTTSRLLPSKKNIVFIKKNLRNLYFEQTSFIPFKNLQVIFLFLCTVFQYFNAFYSHNNINFHSNGIFCWKCKNSFLQKYKLNAFSIYTPLYRYQFSLYAINRVEIWTAYLENRFYIFSVFNGARWKRKTVSNLGR